MPTLEELYQDVLGRPSDPGGFEHWSGKFGSEIDPNEIQQFVYEAQKELPTAKYTAPTAQEAAPAAPPATTIESLYETVLGRAPDVG